LLSEYENTKESLELGSPFSIKWESTSEGKPILSLIYAGIFGSNMDI
jgi:hypothetical protein